MEDGVYYDVHSDSLSKATGYHIIHSKSVDSDDRFFSTPELAKDAYKKYKEKQNLYSEMDDIER